MKRHEYLPIAKLVVGIGGVGASLAAEWAVAFGVGLAAADSGRDEYWLWLAPLSLVPIGYFLLVLFALLGRAWAAIAVAAVAWLVALGAWGWLPGQLANEYASHSMPFVLVALTTGFALAATYLANALRDDAAASPSGRPAGPDWGHPV
ncbi:MAG: hypothetical protein MUE82_12075 [Chloroflexi bacterium]|jgi:hypothetical protein|nr:hypothetical protein [Chloroflexota bacterium]